MKNKFLLFVFAQFLVMGLFSGCLFKPELQVSALSHHFPGDPYTGYVETEWTFKVWNSGGKDSLLKFRVEPDQPWIQVSPDSGLVRANGEYVDVLVKILRNDFPSMNEKSAPLFSTGHIKVFGGGMEKTIGGCLKYL